MAMKEMAKSDYLKSKVSAYNTRMTIGILASVVVSACSALAGVMWVGMFILMGGLGYAAIQHKQSIPYQIGIEGEETLRKKLRQYLSDEYSVFYNISTGHGDIDCVIVGPSGVLALEMKNYVGKVFYTKEGLWGRFRRNSRGTVDRLPISNPSGQLLKNISILKNVLLYHGISVWIDAVVVFSDSVSGIYPEEQPKNFKVTTIRDLPKILSANKNVLSPWKKEHIENLLREWPGFSV